MITTKAKHSIIACLLTLIFIIVTLTACLGPTTPDSGSNSSDKQVPVYQGMSIGPISRTARNVSLLSARLGTNNGNGNNGDNGNHYGQYKGNHSGKEENDDNSNPFPDNGENENIDEEIKSSLEVIGPSSDIYYGESDQDVYIHIYLSNPDDFEILSFTINGQKFSNYMFESGSNMEELILKYNVGDVSGVTEYTIDAIKYIDGTEIKDVVINGEQTIKAGIRRENQVTAEINNLNKLANSVNFDVIISDNDNLIGYSNGSLKAMLYDGDTIVATKDLSVGVNSVSFDSLRTGAPYQVAIVGLYDSFNGNGYGINILNTKTFYTKSVVLFNDIEISDSDIMFSYLWSDDAPIKEITALSLLKDGVIVQELDPGTTEISDLLSGTSYKIIAKYINNNAEESIYLEFTTINKATPSISIDSITQSKDSLNFEITEVDVDNVGEISVIELVHNDKVVETVAPDVRSFTGLMSDNSYTVRVTYTYDLNNGEGAHVIVKEATVVTDVKVAPDFEIKNVIADKNSVSFDIAEVDNDNIGEVSKIELINAVGTVLAENNDVRKFYNTLSDCEYTIKITYTYDMNDGTGVKNVVKSARVKTLPMATPSIQITGVAESKTDIAFSLNEVDVDNIGEIITIELLKGDEVVQIATDSSVRKFESLLSNTAYSIRLTYRYNMNDGSSDVVITRTVHAVTQSFSLPYILISGVSPSTDGITFAIEETDTNNAGNISKIELYRGEELVRSSTDDNTREFNGLLSNTEYTLKVVYVYNMNDGNGNQYSTKEVTVRTFPLVKPNITIDSTDSTKESISFSFNIIDASGIGHIDRVELLLNGEVVKFSADAGTKSFDGLLSDTSYTVKVIYAYDMNDGTGVKYIENTQVIKTEKKATPTVSISDQKFTSTSVEFEISEMDVDSVGSISKIELIHSSGKIITADNTDVRSFTGLLSGNQYTLCITYTYNLNDGKGVQTITKSLDFTTTAKNVPTMSVSSSTKTHNSISFAVSITDTSSVGSISKIELVHVATGKVVIADDNNLRTFTGLLSGNKYTVRVTYTYDLNDGTGVKTIVKEISATTTTVGAPSVSISNVVCDNTTVSFDIKKTDSGNTITKMTASLVLNGTTVETKVITGSASFTNLQYATNYSILVTTYYDVADGKGEKTQTTTASFTTPYYVDSQGISYKTYADGTAEVVKFTEGVTEIIIPETVLNHTVTKIGNSAFYKSKITSVKIPGTVTTIGASAFNSCYNLKTVELNEGLKTIESSAFYSCYPSFVVIPLSVEKIGSYAFYDTTHYVEYWNQFSKVYCKASSRPTGWASNFIGNNYYYTEDRKVCFWGFDEFVEQDGVRYALSHERKEAEVVKATIKKSEYILASEIDGCTVIGIAPYAFYLNNSNYQFDISSLVLPENLEYINIGAFGRVSRMPDLVFPETLKYVDRRSFESGITGAIFTSTTLYIEEEAFLNSSLVTLTIPLNATGCIEENAFSNSDNLKFVNIPFDMTVYDNAFSDCEKVYFASIVDRRPSGWGDEWEDGIPVYWSSYIDDQGIVYKLNYNIMYEDQPTMTVIDYVNSGRSAAYISDRVLGRVVWMIGEEAFWDTDLNDVYVPKTVEIIAERAFDTNISDIYQIGSPLESYWASYDNYNGMLYQDSGEGIEFFATLPLDNYRYVLYEDYYDEETYEYYDFYVKKLDVDYTHITIPSTIDGKPVTKIGYGLFENMSEIVSITLPESLISIEGDAFYGCSSLKNINIPSSVTSIGGSAFNGCTSLETITIPNSVTSIGGSAFSNCSNLKEINIPYSITHLGSYLFYNCTNLTNVTIPNTVTYIDSYAFYNCTNLTEVNISDGVISIGDYSFYNCINLENITIPDSITYIKQNAFTGCNKIIEKENSIYYVGKWCIDADEDITEIVLREGTVGITEYAFNNCASITEVVIPDSVVTLGHYAFGNCTSLTNVVLHDGLDILGAYAFAGCENIQYNEYENAYYIGSKTNPYLALVKAKDLTITSVTIHENAKFILQYAFKDCTKLEEIYFNAIEMNDVIIQFGSSYKSTTIFYNAGINSNGIKLVIGSKVKRIPADLFTAWSSSTAPKIVSVEFAEGSICESIGDNAFECCASLVSISQMPDSLTYIGNDAFARCSSLEEIKFGSGIKYIGNRVFADCTSLHTVHIKSLEGWCNLSFTSTTDAPLYYAENLYLNGAPLTEVVIPEGVTSISKYAFYHCDSLESIVIPDSVTSIGEYAFYYCTNLKNVTLGKGVKSIGSWAFYHCESLESIVIPDNVTNIENYAFAYCLNLNTVTLSKEMTKIDDGLFNHCTSLKTVIVPDTITSIGTHAFSSTNNNSISIKYYGTSTQWTKISKGSLWDYNSRVYVSYNYTGE